MKIALAFIVAISCAGPAAAQTDVLETAGSCVEIANAAARLRCFDQAFLRAPVPANREGADVEIDDVASTLIVQKAMGCWTVPDGEVPSAIRLSVRLHPDGTIVGTPSLLDSASGAAAEAFNNSALAAVLACAPYDEVLLGQTTTVVVTLLGVR